MDAMDSMSKKSDGFEASVAWWHRVVWWIALAYLVFRAGLFARLGVVLMGYPFDVDNNEGFVLRDAAELAAGGRLYTDITQPPFWVTQYTPFYPLVASILIRLGVAGMQGCRAVSLASTGLIAFFIYLGVRRRGCSRLAAATAALLFPASTYVVLWGAVAKGDVFGCMWAMAGLWLLGTKPRPGVVAAAVCFCLALYTRQSLIAAPVAAGIVLLRRDRKLGLLFCSVFLGLSAAAFIALEVATGGEFARHVFAYTVGRFDVKEMVSSEFCFFRDHFILVAAACAVLLRRLRQRRLTIVAAYVPLAFLVTLTCGRAGASSNYFLELLAVLCLCSGEAFDALRSRSAAVGLAVLAGVILQSLPATSKYSGVDYWLRPPGQEAWEDGQRLVALLRAAPGPVLCEFHGYTLLAKRKVLFHHYALTDLVRRGLWDQTPVLARMRRGEFAFIACDPVDLGRWTPEMMDAMRRSYTLVARFRVYQIDGPRQLAGLAPTRLER